MSIVPILLMGYTGLLAGYLVLKKSITGVVQPRDENKTPAARMNDGKDFVPARPAVLFGHHYMSIAGTSPIIASIVGLVWGWGPALLWMFFGVLLLGAVHDYYALMVSVRHGGRSMGDVVREAMGSFTGLLASVVLAFGGILVYAIFLSIISSTLASQHSAVIPTLVLIPLAMGCGLLLKKGFPLFWVTLLGLLLTAFAVFLGMKVPIEIPARYWSIFFLFYTFAAVYTPVWILLQPRDYLNSAILFAGLLLGFAGLLAGAPPVKFPFFQNFSSPIRGPLWPMLFVTISCGAASGWHSLIAAGTTSKQLAREKHGFSVAFGGMLGETFMAILSGALIITAFTWTEYSATGLQSSAIGNLFSQGLGKAMGFLGLSETLGATLGALALAALTLTTLDSFARTSRYVVQELAGASPAANLPSRRKGNLLSRFLSRPLGASLFVSLAGYFLFSCVPFMELWNGLVLAGLLLLLLPFAILLLEKRGKKERFRSREILHLLLPLAFLFPTTLAGLFYLFYEYTLHSYREEGAIKWVSAALVLFLLVLLFSIVLQLVKRLVRPLSPMNRERRGERLP